jgi:hypothetical protein
MSKLNFANRVRIDRTFLEPKPRATQKAQKGPKGKRNSRRAEELEEQEYNKVTYPVWALPTSRAPKSTMDFEWPTFNTHKEHIKGFTELAKGLTITEAFEAGYGIKINIDPKIKAQVDNAPSELHVGDELEMNVRNIDKRGVEFDCPNLKQQISSCVNLNRFETFKHFIPKDPIKVRVVSSTREKVVVDPLSPMLDEWMKPILENPGIQRVIAEPQTIMVKDLKLTKGGFVGRAVIPNISRYLAEDYTIEAFIPGSQIVLNIEDDFNKWVGKTVYAFVTNYIPKPGNINQMSLICSVKEYLKFIGERNMMDLYDKWCDDGKEWEVLSREVLSGRVTGIINSSKKCGVFVEVPALNITGMVNVKAEELVNYKPGDRVGVRLTNFEENVYYDDTWKQLRHEEPYRVENGILTKCNLKPVLGFVTDAQPA